MRWLRYAIPVLAVIGALAALWLYTTPDQRPAMIDPAANATYGDLILDTADGPLKLSGLRGKTVVVYFGYTSCPDICPTTLQTVAAAFHRMTPAEQQDLALILVSVDPERDELVRLQEYAGYFHPNFRGGTSSPQAVAAMAKDWGVQFRKVESPGSAMGYTVDHTTHAFLVDAEGEMVRVIPHGTTVAEVQGMLEDVG